MGILHFPPLLLALALSLPMTAAFLPPLPHAAPNHAALRHAAASRLLQSARPQPRDGATGLMAAANEGDGRRDAAGSANKGRIRFRAQGGPGGGVGGRAGSSGALGLVTEEGQGDGEVAVEEGGKGALLGERVDVRFEGFGKRDDVAGAEAGQG